MNVVRNEIADRRERHLRSDTLESRARRDSQFALDHREGDDRIARQPFATDVSLRERTACGRESHQPDQDGEANHACRALFPERSLP